MNFFANKTKFFWCEIALVIWFVIGILWFIVQFGISEIAYQASIYTEQDEISTALSDLSDAAAWPAGWVYEYLQNSRFKSETEAFLANADPLLHENRKRVQALLEQYHHDFSDYDLLAEISTILIEADPHSEANLYLDESSTYFIYVGVCFGWATLISCLGLVASVIVIIFVIPSPNAGMR